MNQYAWVLSFLALGIAVDSFGACRFDLYSTNMFLRNRKGDLQVAQRMPSELNNIQSFPALREARAVNYYEGEGSIGSSTQENLACNKQSRVEVEVGSTGWFVINGITAVKRVIKKGETLVPFALVPEDEFGEETILAFDEKKSTCVYGGFKDTDGIVKGEKVPCKDFLNEKIPY